MYSSTVLSCATEIDHRHGDTRKREEDIAGGSRMTKDEAENTTKKIGQHKGKGD